MQYILVYITTKDRDEAERIAAAVVSEGLAACANILDSMRSLYWWNGQMESATETILLLKSELDRFEALQKKVTQLHSYETPCIVALPIIAGSRAYLDWISASCKQNSN